MGGAVETATRARGYRTLRGLYPASQLGRAAADGAVLDLVVDGFAVASAWRDPGCEDLRCVRPAVARMLPPSGRVGCRQHGPLVVPDVDPYPLSAEEREHAEAATWRGLGPRLGVPTRYLDVAFESSVATPALDAARRFVAQESTRGVVWQGGPGCGKSHALHCALRRLALDNVAADGRAVIRSMEFTALSERLLDRAQAHAVLAACRSATVLLLDDLGAGFVKPGGFVTACIEDLVVHREARELGCCITTNLVPSAFARLFGARVFDRLRGEWGAWFDVSGPSLRRKERRA